MLNSKVSKVKTYVGSDGKLHFVNSAGADTALNFSSKASCNLTISITSSSYAHVGDYHIYADQGGAKLTGSITISIANGAASISSNNLYLYARYAATGVTNYAKVTPSLSVT